jgi:hypothetical protein
VNSLFLWLFWQKKRLKIIESFNSFYTRHL